MKTNNIHYILWIYKKYGKILYYSIQEYDYDNFILKRDFTFNNKYELKLYLGINGIKFDNFKTYSDYSGAKLESYYEN